MDDIVAWVGVITGLGGLIIAWRTSRASARKDEVEALRGIIRELRAEVERWKAKHQDLLDRYRDLLERYRTLEQRYQQICTWVRDKLGFDPEAVVEK